MLRCCASISSSCSCSLHSSHTMEPWRRLCSDTGSRGASGVGASGCPPMRLHTTLQLPLTQLPPPPPHPHPPLPLPLPPLRLLRLPLSFLPSAPIALLTRATVLCASVSVRLPMQAAAPSH